MGVTVKTDTKELKQLGARMQAAHNMVTSVGFLGADGQFRYETGVNVATVAMWNEFGTKNSDGSTRNPARAFMRQALVVGQEQIAAFSAKAYARMVVMEISALETQKAIAKFVALMVRDSIATAIRWAKPNRPSTVAKKGRNQPLQELGILLRSVGWEVRASTIGGAQGAVLARGNV